MKILKRGHKDSHLNVWFSSLDGGVSEIFASFKTRLFQQNNPGGCRWKWGGRRLFWHPSRSFTSCFSGHQGVEQVAATSITWGCFGCLKKLLNREGTSRGWCLFSRRKDASKHLWWRCSWWSSNLGQKR